MAPQKEIYWQGQCWQYLGTQEGETFVSHVYGRMWLESGKVVSGGITFDVPKNGQNGANTGRCEEEIPTSRYEEFIAWLEGVVE
jgi:hypothetical protein